MFPVPTGMNRNLNSQLNAMTGVPRAHGDEPPPFIVVHGDAGVFPVPTGMNR